jgi:hypothetical protein
LECGIELVGGEIARRFQTTAADRLNSGSGLPTKTSA